MAKDFYAEHYGQLVGKKVVQIGKDDGEEFNEAMYCLIFSDGTKAWIMRDPEGNGPGHMDIEGPSLKELRAKEG